jgi:hypothetical protein
MSPQAPQQSPPTRAPLPQPDTQYRPAEDAAEPDAPYRQQRELEYRRVLREAIAPIPADDAPYRPRESEYRRIAPAPPPNVDLPFPRSREKADQLD